MIDYWIIGEYLIFKPEFNDSLDKYSNLLNKYTRLIFSNYNDWKICFETNNEYMNVYDKQHIGSKFNKPIELNQNLTHLTTGYEFNHLIELTDKIFYLHLDSNLYNIIDNLPTSIKTITLKCDIYVYEYELNYLPMSVEYLKLNFTYNKKISNIQKKLKKIVCSKKYSLIDDFAYLIVETYKKINIHALSNLIQ